jgi:hypothetical protein
VSRIIEKQPPAKILVKGIRAIGYSFSTAVADIIDNSIPVNATMLKVYSDALAPVPYFCILDNGAGMNSDELENAMLLGSDREGKQDGETELGRFGLGLKAASLSQCREFIVVSKQRDVINAMSFDLDEIERTNKWILKILDDGEIKKLPCIAQLMKHETGTLVGLNSINFLGRLKTLKILSVRLLRRQRNMWLLYSIVFMSHFKYISMTNV